MTGPLRSGATATSDVRLYKGLALFVITAFLLLGMRLWHLQVAKGDQYYRRTADNFVKEVELPASRGQIRDRNGRVLVDNRPSYQLYVKPSAVTDEGIARLGRHLTLTEAELAELNRKIATQRSKKGAERLQELLVSSDIGRDAVARIESDGAALTGLRIETSERRDYLHGSLASHVLGYMNQVSAEELNALRGQGYHVGDNIGRAGLERQWESYLRGKSGVERYIQDARGNIKTDLARDEVEDLIGLPLRRDPQPGDNLVLTLDMGLQRAAEHALAEHHSAAAVVLEVATGRVLALASHPGFDPNVLSGRLTRAEDERLQQDPFRPLHDKAVRENYFPASTFKIVPALAALEAGVIDAGDRTMCSGAYHMPGRAFHCMHAHGSLDLYGALVQSCNVYFYRLGDRLGLGRMAELAAELGYGEPTGIGLPGEAPGFIATPEFYAKRGGYSAGQALNTAIGQGSTKVTLLQQALAYAAVANGGRLYVPQLVARIETADGRIVQQFEPRLRRALTVAPRHMETLRRALCGVVNDPRGTAHSAYDPTLAVEVCGKSGTAQLGKVRKGEQEGWNKSNDHAWFTGFAPARQPEVAIAVLVEHGGLGGHVAGPTAVAILKAYFDRTALRAQVPGDTQLPTSTVVP